MNNNSEGGDRQTQIDEIECLRSIYYGEEFHVVEFADNKNIQVIFLAFTQLQENFVVKYKENLNSSEEIILTVRHLPPIELNVTLPKNYPSKHAPDFMLSCQWLEVPVISRLCKKLDDLWSENKNSEIIFIWCDFLKNEALQYIDVVSVLDITEIHHKHLKHVQLLKDRQQLFQQKQQICQEKKRNGRNGEHSGKSAVVGSSDSKTSHTKDKTERLGYHKQNCESRDRRAAMKLSLRTNIVRIIVNYDMERRKIEFNKSYYTCNVCFLEKQGRECVQFPDCEHVFCKECMREYLTVKINDGQVKSLKCPEHKCSSDASQAMVRELVSEELFERYDKLLLSTTLDTLSDIIYCPRTFCQYPCSRDVEEGMATCPACDYAFCIYCKKVYHGIEPCRIKSFETKELIESYRNAAPDARVQMELRYGKKQLEALTNNSMSEEWLQFHSKNCPKCNAHIEKSEGCNKMACSKCNTYFCWLCGTQLSHNNPYDHYNNPKSKCADKLFFLALEEDDDEAWVEWDVVDFSEESDLSDIEVDEPDTDNEIYINI